MDRFAGMRFNELTRTATAVALGGAAVMAPADVLAVAVTGTGTGAFMINAGNAIWWLNNNITFATTSNNWGFSEGSLSGGVFDDAFDGAVSWLVATGAPTSADGYRSPGGTIDISPAFPTNPAVATTATGSVQVMAGLNVHGEIYFPTNRAVARSILVLQNPTGAPITVNVETANNWGSDNNTTYDATSSGDALYGPSDNWTVSSQSNPPTCCDPPLTYAFNQNGSAIRGTANPIPVTGNGFMAMFYTVTIPAGQTRRLMAFMQMSTSVAGAIATAPTFNTAAGLAGAGLLNGLTPATAVQIVNWNGAALAAVLSGAAVPTLGEWSLIALASLLGLLGMRTMAGTIRPRRYPAA